MLSRRFRRNRSEDAVAETGQRRSELAGKGIKKAKNGHSMRDLTMHLFYATDFVGGLDAGTPITSADEES